MHTTSIAVQVPPLARCSCTAAPMLGSMAFQFRSRRACLRGADSINEFCDESAMNVLGTRPANGPANGRLTAKHQWWHLRRCWTRVLAALLASVLVCGCVSSGDLVPDKSMVGVSVSAVGHYGSMIGVPTYSIDGRPIGRASGWGGGGAKSCCVLVPRNPTKPVTINVKWQTCDIGHIEFMNDRIVDPTQKCKVEEHEATIPVHFAVPSGESSGVYLHFLPGHRVEAWISWPGPASTEYPGPSYPRGPAPRYAPLPGEKPQPPTQKQ